MKDGRWEISFSWHNPLFPQSAVYALVDLMAVIFGHPKGLFKNCKKGIQYGMQIIQDELEKLGITDGATEVDLKHSAIWMAGVYLMLLMQFLENKVAVELTRSEFVEAQGKGVPMLKKFKHGRRKQIHNQHATVAYLQC